MKKIHKVLIPSLIATSIGLSLFGVINQASKSYELASANLHNHITGFYEKITDISTIEDGEVIVIAIYNNELFTYFGGNPAYPCFRSENSYFSNDFVYVGADNSPGTEFTVHIQNNDEYIFRASMEFAYTDNPVSDCLLAYESRDNGTDFNGVGYFKDNGFGAISYSSSNMNKAIAHWHLSYNTNTESSENITMTNVSNSGCSKSYAFYRKHNIQYSYSNT